MVYFIEALIRELTEPRDSSDNLGEGENDRAPLRHGSPVTFTLNGVTYAGEIWDIAGALRPNSKPSTVKVKVTGTVSSRGSWIPVSSSKKAMDVPTSSLRMGSKY